MSRLIDADALMQEFAEFVRDSNNSDFADVPTWNDAVSLLGSAPTIEERKKGKWIHDGFDIPHGVDWMHCSVCGRREPHVPAAMTSFCPSCGADMRGEGNG